MLLSNEGNKYLTDQLAIVLNRGLGALVAERFAAEGSNVAINYVASADRAKETAEKIEKEYGVKTVVLQGVSSG